MVLIRNYSLLGLFSRSHIRILTIFRRFIRLRSAWLCATANTDWIKAHIYLRFFNIVLQTEWLLRCANKRWIMFRVIICRDCRFGIANCFEAKCVTKRTKIERYHAAAFHVAHALPFFFPLLPHRCFCSVVLTLRYAMQTIEPLHRGLAYTTVSITGTIVYCTGCNNCFKHSYLAPALFFCRNPTRFRFENVLNCTRVLHEGLRFPAKSTPEFNRFVPSLFLLNFHPILSNLFHFTNPLLQT